jgi:hypothetical protein
MPGWRDIRPSKLARQLPILWSYAYDAASGVFVGRLAGLRVEEKFTIPFKGSRMDELYTLAGYAKIAPLAKRSVGGPALCWSKGSIFTNKDYLTYGERIILPLSEDGVHPDGILGATEFAVIPIVTSGDLPENEDTLQLFPEDPA